MDTSSEMRIESIEEDRDEVLVMATGAEYLVDKSGKNGRILCHQRIGKRRLVLSLEFNYPFSDMTIEKRDGSSCILDQTVGGGGAYLRIQVNSDSLLDVYCCRELRINCSGGFLPEYVTMKDGNLLLIDEDGGVGIYPYKGLRSAEVVGISRKGWKATYGLDECCRALFSVFPPRKFNIAQSFRERISHHFSWVNPYPSDEMIEEASRYTNILVLHSQIWLGKYTRIGRPVKSIGECYADASWVVFDYTPVNESELRRVVDKAHSLGMRVIPYMSPFYSSAKGKDFTEKVRYILERYSMDGVYFDGISSDKLYSYQMVREVRNLLKDRILYVHCTSDPMMSINIYCPFIDTYADYILRAEHVTEFADEYLRYVISGYNISNSIGYICYYDYSPKFIEELIEKAIKTNARFYLGLPIEEREKLLIKEYFPRLKTAAQDAGIEI